MEAKWTWEKQHLTAVVANFMASDFHDTRFNFDTTSWNKVALTSPCDLRSASGFGVSFPAKESEELISRPDHATRWYENSLWFFSYRASELCKNTFNMAWYTSAWLRQASQFNCPVCVCVRGSKPGGMSQSNENSCEISSQSAEVSASCSCYNARGKINCDWLPHNDVISTPGKGRDICFQHLCAQEILLW
jgi:hypothetical protein